MDQNTDQSDHHALLEQEQEQLNEQNAQQDPQALAAAIENHRVARLQRAGIMQRMVRWIGFVALPEFAEMDLHETNTRIGRGIALLDQLLDVQRDTIRAAVLARQPIADYGNELMEMEEQYYNA